MIFFAFAALFEHFREMTYLNCIKLMNVYRNSEANANLIIHKQNESFKLKKYYVFYLIVGVLTIISLQVLVL